MIGGSNFKGETIWVIAKTHLSHVMVQTNDLKGRGYVTFVRERATIRQIVKL